jgi:hypothetical protein
MLLVLSRFEGLPAEADETFRFFRQVIVLTPNNSDIQAKTFLYRDVDDAVLIPDDLRHDESACEVFANEAFDCGELVGMK